MAPLRRAAPVLCSFVALAVLAGGCTGGGSPPPSGTGTTVAGAPRPGPEPTPRKHLADAVRDLLAAEERGDRAASFRLLSRRSRVEYKDVADWTERRQQLPEVTGFRIDPGSDGDRGDRAGKVVAVVEHVPGIDPFTGLSPARENQTFTGEKEGDGWLVDADPETEVLLPPEPLAVEAATSWVTAVQACDQAGAARLQAVATIFGTADGATGLCGRPGPVTPGRVGRLAPGIASSDIVAQYSTDALFWARVVRITSPSAFGVVLAPLGERWRVLGVTD